MPTVNVYSGREVSALPTEFVSELKRDLAARLTCGDIALTEDEISVRFLPVDGSMIGSMELEIKAHAFKERVDRQDEISNEIRDFVMGRLPDVGDVRVWLVLSELGHSF